MLSGIYFIRNIINNKIYVGSAVNLKRRFHEHWSRLKYNKHSSSYLQRAWNKYGKEAFRFEIIEICLKSQLIEKETNYIKLYNSTDENFGYNSCPTGVSALGRKHSEETKRKIGLAHKGKKLEQYQIEALRKANIGKIHSEERRKAHGNRVKGRKHPPRSKEFIERITKINTELAKRRWNKRPTLILDLKNQIQPYER